MRRATTDRHRLGTAAVVAVALAASAPAAATEVVITNPVAGLPTYGEIELRAEVSSPEPIRHVDFFVDGVPVGRDQAPPYAVSFDLGQANVAHHVRAVAESVFGVTTESSLTTASIRVDEAVEVELLQLFVSVSDSRGRRVPGLAETDFTVRDDRGRREEIVTFFGGGDLPISSVLLVDSSESMQGRPLEAAIQGATAFATLTREDDEVMVALFSDRLLRATRFTNDPSLLQESLHGVTAAGGTAVNDHLYYALNRLEARLGRRVIVLLSDGHDISSVLDMSQVQWRARRSQAMIYWIRLEHDEDEVVPQFNSNWRDSVGNERQFQLLTEAVLQSGGRIIAIERLGELDHAFRSVMQELREQYVLGYHPRNRKFDGSWRKISVRARGSGLTVRARDGFVD